MGYQPEIYRSIREEYEKKAGRAVALSEERRKELHEKIAGLSELDARLSGFGLRIMQEAMAGGDVANGIAKLREENLALQKERAELLQKNGYPADYSDVHYECNACFDTGFCGIEMCECMKKRLAQASLENSGMGALLRRQTFDNFSLEYYRSRSDDALLMKENLAKVKSYAETFGTPAWQEKGEWNLLMIGGTGLGKTHLSSAVANCVAGNGYDVFYSSAVGMISAFESQRFGSGISAQGTIDPARFTECDLLILDDLGTEVVNQFTLSCLYDVINQRLNREKATIVSTNLTSGELRETYSDRITSRLLGEFRVILFRGEDVRKQKIRTK